MIFISAPSVHKSGTSYTKCFPVKNAGNITVDVLFSTLKYQDVLAVTPCNTVLQPGEKVEIAVRFKPDQNCKDQDEYLTDVIMAVRKHHEPSRL